MKFKYVIIGLILLLGVVSCPLPDGETGTYAESLTSYLDYRSKSTDWTVMYYVDGDNNLESYLLDDISELSEGLESTDLINVIALVDRTEDDDSYYGYSDDSSILGSNFADTRLFRIGSGEIYDIPGEEYFPDIGENLSGEYNMGDVETLKSFIEYCKTYYPAEHYALIISDHGSGVWSLSSSSSSSRGSTELELSSRSDSRAVSIDETDGDDALFIGELTDSMDNSHSVDLLVFDACVMGLAEIAYEYRPVSAGGAADKFGVDYMAASAPNVWGDGLPYDFIFDRISQNRTGGTGRYSGVSGSSIETQYYNPESMTPEEFGRIIVEEQERDTQQIMLPYYESLSPTLDVVEAIELIESQSFALYDLSEIGNVVDTLDSAASGMHSSTSDDMDLHREECLSYGEDPIAYPHFDLYDFAVDLNDTDLINAVDSLVVASFGGPAYEQDFNNNIFAEGKEGLGFFFPDGDATYNSEPYWNYQWWYTGVDVSAWWDGHYYGNLDFCHADGDGTVDGYYELLQYLYNNPYDDDAHPGQW